MPSIPRLVSLAQDDLLFFLSCLSKVLPLSMAIALGLTFAASVWLLGRVGTPVWRSLSVSTAIFPVVLGLFYVKLHLG